MSTLVVSNINDGTTTVPATYVTNGSAKAWVSTAGLNNPITIRDSLNISSITDNATGLFTATFSSSMADDGYSSTASTWQSSAVTGTGINLLNPFTNSQQVDCYESNTRTDPIKASLTIIGDLA